MQSLKNEFNDISIQNKLSLEMLKCFKSSTPIIVCVGSDMVLSDMFALIVAELLRNSGIKTLVFGGIKNPINKFSLKEIFKIAKSKNILVVDSAILSQKLDIVFRKHTILNDGTILSFPSILCGTVSMQNNQVLLAKTRFVDIIKCANVVKNAIYDFFKYKSLFKCGGF